MKKFTYIIFIVLCVGIVCTSAYGMAINDSNLVIVGLPLTGCVILFATIATVIWLRKRAEQDRKQFEELLKRQAAEKAEREAKERAEHQKRLEEYLSQKSEYEEKLKHIFSPEYTDFHTPTGYSINMVKRTAARVLHALSATPMSLNEISAVLSLAYDRYEIYSAIRFIGLALPLEEGKKTETTEKLSLGILCRDVRTVTTYALYENLGASVLAHIDAGQNGDKLNKRITMDGIDLMNGKEFEQYISKLFEKMGYKTEVTKSSGDQGLDVIAKKSGESIGIQAKRYSGTVGNSAVQEAAAGKALYSVDKVMVITNNEFTPGAKKLAQANDVMLWNRNILKEKVGRYGGRECSG